MYYRYLSIIYDISLSLYPSIYNTWPSIYLFIRIDNRNPKPGPIFAGFETWDLASAGQSKMYADLDSMRGLELAVGFSECEPSVGVELELGFTV